MQCRERASWPLYIPRYTILDKSHYSSVPLPIHYEKHVCGNYWTSPHRFKHTHTQSGGCVSRVRPMICHCVFFNLPWIVFMRLHTVLSTSHEGWNCQLHSNWYSAPLEEENLLSTETWFSACLLHLWRALNKSISFGFLLTWFDSHFCQLLNLWV